MSKSFLVLFFKKELLPSCLFLASAAPCLAAALSVCIDASSPTAPRDQRLAEAVARQEGTALSVYHFDGNSDDDGVAARVFRNFAATRCQLVLGYPIDMTQGAPPPGLAATVPYDQTGFVLVMLRPRTASGLADLPAGTDVAVTYLSVPNLYFIGHSNVQADVEHTDADTLQALLDARVKAAMVWQATATQFTAGHPGAPLNLSLLKEPHARWNIVGLYGPAGAAAAAAFNGAVAALQQAGKLAPILVSEQARGTAASLLVQPAALQVTPPAAAQSALPALYTQDQADNGLSKFSAYCAKCHGDQLQGRSGPALKGRNFATKKSAFTVADVFHIVSQNMPAAQPGSLQHDDYVEIMAFLLQQNGYPAGTTALTFDAANASLTPLLYHGN